MLRILLYTICCCLVVYGQINKNLTPTQDTLPELNYEPLNISLLLEKNKQGIYETTNFLKQKINEGHRNFYFLPGTYIIKNLTLPSNITLRGSERGTIFISRVDNAGKKLGVKNSKTFKKHGGRKLGGEKYTLSLYSEFHPKIFLIRNQSNIIIEGIEFIYPTTNQFFSFETIDAEHISQKYSAKANFIDIKDSKNISLRKLYFKFSNGHGIKIQNSENISISESHFKRLTTAIAVNRSKNITIEENQIFINAIGIYIYESKNVNIQNNFIANNENNLSIQEYKNKKYLDGNFYHKVHYNHIGHGEKTNLLVKNSSIPTTLSYNTFSFGIRPELGNSDWLFYDNNFFAILYNNIEFPSVDLIAIPHLRFSTKRQRPIYFIGNTTYISFLKAVAAYQIPSTYNAEVIVIKFDLHKIIKNLFSSPNVIKLYNINISHFNENKFNDKDYILDLFVKRSKK